MNVRVPGDLKPRRSGMGKSFLEQPDTSKYTVCITMSDIR